MSKIRIAKTAEGNHIRITDKDYVGKVVLTRRNTLETIVHIYQPTSTDVRENRQPELDLTR